LDGGLNAQEYDTQAGSKSGAGSLDLQDVRRNGKPFSASSRLQQTGRVPGVVSALPHQGRSTGRTSEAGAAEVVHALRNDVSAATQQEAFAVQSSVPIGNGTHQRPQEMGQWVTEPDIPRVAKGVKNRVSRLGGLGNAVVPQIPEIIGRAILKAEQG
jgi:DNA (cytosine-5)-methyltransferase 1